MFTNRRSHVLMMFAVLAVVGLLSMHGFDSVIPTIDDDGHASHSRSADPIDHGVIGLCVFVAAVAGFGLSTARRHGPVDRPYDADDRSRHPSPPVHPPGRSGPPLRLRLCVLRL